MATASPSAVAGRQFPSCLDVNINAPPSGPYLSNSTRTVDNAGIEHPKAVMLLIMSSTTRFIIFRPVGISC